MFQPTANLFEVLLRVLLVYGGLALLVRITRKKELGQLAPMDFLAMLLLSETVSPALTAGDTSVTTGLVAAISLLGLTYLVDWLTFRSTAAARLLYGHAKVLVRDGHVVEDVRDQEKLSLEEIQSAVRREGIDDLLKVKLAFIETNRRISVIPKAP
jgi:uncharacterized membrane protein YcaP (DUF421 family)